MDVIEAMETCIAMRYLKEDPVPPADLERLVYAATRASSPGNSQEWEFLVLSDAAKKAEIGAAIWSAVAPMFENLTADASGVRGRMYTGASHLARNFAKIPAWILGCARNNYPPQAPVENFMYSAVYPAAQNLIVAARAMGLGTTFTTFQRSAEPVIRRVLSIPDDIHMCVLVAVGYPEKPFAPVKRKPVSDVLHWNGW